MYDVSDYDSMFADAARTEAYLDAISRVVGGGSVVVEVGTGVGYFAVAACRAGARRVYAIESNPAVAIAPEVAAENGCADRIAFIRGDSRRVTLPERGDVLLSDLRGVLPLNGDHIATLVDARTRLVKPGAALVPERDTLWVAPCTAPQEWNARHAFADGSPHGITRRVVEQRVRSDWSRCHLGAGDLIADPVKWAALEYRTVESRDAAGRAEWVFSRDAVADGLAIWFDGELGGGATISNSPRAPRALYGQGFFPFERPLAVRAGDRLAVEIFARHLHGDYVWQWNSTLASATGAPPVAMRQSNFAAHVVSPAWLQSRSAERRPRRGSVTEIWSTMLGLVDGTRTLGAIASAVRAAHPAHFASDAAAFEYVGSHLAALDDEEGDACPPTRSTV